MTSTGIAAEGNLARTQEPSLAAVGTSYVATLRAEWQRRAKMRRMCAQLEALDDRLLLDIGLDEADIARLRSGEPFAPSLLQR